MRVIFAFIRSTFHTTYIYRLDFWVRFFATCIMMYGTYSLWNILYTQSPEAFGMTREQMTTYGALGMMLAPVLDSANFVWFYISEQVRQGTLELDLMKPLDFIFHMLSRHIGVFVVHLLFQGLPGFVFARYVLGIGIPESAQIWLMFIVSVFLGFLIFFGLSVMIGLLSVITLKVDSVAWAYFSMVDFASGQLIPLWMFPPAIGAILAALPFKFVYFVPMSIYIGAAEVEPGVLIFWQVCWVIALLIAAHFFWTRVQRRIIVQGG